MSEKITVVYPVEVKYYCDDCKTGELLPTGECLMSYPAQYPHICNNCGTKRNFSGKQYPMTRYLTKEQIKEIENESSS